MPAPTSSVPAPAAQAADPAAPGRTRRRPPPAGLPVRAAAWALAGLCGVALSGCATAPGSAASGNTAPGAGASGVTAPAVAAQPAPQPVACPGGLPADTRCLATRDTAGAHVLVAIPADWNRQLVVHAHGGPVLGAPRAERTAEDLQRWSIMVRAGYAWVGSSFAQGGVAVRAAAADTERARQLFEQHLGRPTRTWLHGQSWGASVAAIAAETYTRTADGRAPYDGVLLTSGVLGGGTHSYDVRLDLRVLYQQLCNNHPRPDEPAYPLWRGLPDNSPLTPAQLATRTRDCLGVGLPAAQRSPEQARKLRTLAAALRIPESSVQGHLNWATFHFRDIAQRMGDRPVFGNRGVVYSGFDDDTALNAAVPRYQADPEAVARFAADTNPTGRLSVPTVAVHGIRDAVAFVELEHQFQRTVQAAGAGHRLVQTFTDDAEHSYLSDPVYPALLAALTDWVERGDKPTPQAVADRCQALQARYGAGCRFQPGYQPAPLESRVRPRQRP